MIMTTKMLVSKKGLFIHIWMVNNKIDIDLNINFIHKLASMSLRTIEKPEHFRANIRKKIDEKLNNEKASLNLEKGIFNYTLKEADHRKIIKKWDNKFFVQIYLGHLKSILINLNDKWIEAINSGEIQSHKLAFMNHQELNHEKWSHLIDVKSKRDANKFETNVAAATDTFTCRKCKGNKCTYYLMQTRSSDEPMTCFIQCTICNNRWKTS
jgi:DNA-directed RNA polymerase subunit M/transcription elongation factor TFIIS